MNTVESDPLGQSVATLPQWPRPQAKLRVPHQLQELYHHLAQVVSLLLRSGSLKADPLARIHPSKWITRTWPMRPLPHRPRPGFPLAFSCLLLPALLFSGTEVIFSPLLRCHFPPLWPSLRPLRGTPGLIIIRGLPRCRGPILSSTRETFRAQGPIAGFFDFFLVTLGPLAKGHW